MRSFIYGMVTTALLLACTDARAEVFKCTDEDGGLTYQQTPCPEPKQENDEAEATEETSNANEVEEVADRPAAVDTAEPTSPEALAQCKKKYRDAIDAIDTEMRLSYTPEQAEHYKQQLRGLTEQLRAC